MAGTIPSWVASLTFASPDEHVGDRRRGVAAGRRSSPTGCPAGRGRSVSTSRPTRRSTSARVRTVVVLPVPPFSDRTAIVSAMRPARYAGPLTRLRRGRLSAGAGGRHGVQEVQAWRPIDDLVAVGQRAPLHAPAVDLDAVERAVVEHAYAALLAGDQGMTARDRRVVEADVGGQRAADPRPLPADRDDDDAAVLLEREVAAGAAEAGPRLLRATPAALGLRRG